MIFDGGTSYLGVRQTNNILRYYSGAFFGFTLPFFLIPAANFNPGIKNIRRSINNIFEVLILIIINFIVGYIILETNILPWFLLATVTIGTLIYVIARIIFTIVTRTMVKKKPLVSIIVAGGTIGVLFILFCFSSFILQPLKSLLLDAAWR
jgi:hypothetical protein